MVWDPKSKLVGDSGYHRKLSEKEPQCETQAERESAQTIIMNRAKHAEDQLTFYLWLTRAVASHPPSPEVERKLWEFLISNPF